MTTAVIPPVRNDTGTVWRTGTSLARRRTSGPHTPRRPDIEGLRAVAVSLVVLYHCDVAVLRGGYVGVDVFFVISGFLITGLLLRELRDSGGISLAGFYARRALRLLPAASLVILATVAASAWWLPSTRRQSILLDGLYTLGYGINYRLAEVGTDYLRSAADPSPLQHFWSLAVEEQYYLLWPVLLAGAAALRRGAIPLAVGTVTAGSLGVSVWQTTADPGHAYFGAHTRAWELGAGALVALAAAPLARLPRRWAGAAAVLGLAAIVSAATAYTSGTAFPGYTAALPVAGAAAVVAAGCARPARVLTFAPLQLVGRLSYSWYLWHWPLLVVVPFAADRDLGVPEKLAVAAAALVLAQLTYVLVEDPVRGIARLRAAPWRGIVAGLAVAAVTAGACLMATTTIASHVDRRPAYQARRIVPGAFDVRLLPGVIAESASLPAVPANLVPDLDEALADSPALYADGCSATTLEVAVETPCEYGDLTSPTTVVLFGDSHAAHWFPALERIARTRRWKLVVVTKGGCHAAEALVRPSTLRRDFTECAAWRIAAWKRISELRPAGVVMVSSIVGNRLSDRYRAGSPEAEDRVWRDGWMRTVDQVGRTGPRLFYVEDTPYFPAYLPDCLSRHLWKPQRCTWPVADVVQRPDRRRKIANAMRARGVTVIDPVPWFCTDSTCPAVIGNALVYRDGHHITTGYSRMLAPLLLPHLRLPARGRTGVAAGRQEPQRSARSTRSSASSHCAGTVSPSRGAGADGPTRSCTR